MRLTLNKDYESGSRAQPVQTPEYFPARGSPEQRVKVVRSARIIHCVSHNGVTKCIGSSARSRELQTRLGVTHSISFQEDNKIC